jgi:hypothetical protein
MWRAVVQCLAVERLGVWHYMANGGAVVLLKWITDAQVAAEEQVGSTG